jgi:hypothetical protein
MGLAISEINVQAKLTVSVLFNMDAKMRYRISETNNMFNLKEK